MDGFVVDALTVKVREELSKFDIPAKPIYTDGTDVPLEPSSVLFRRVMAEAPFGSSDIEEYDRFLELARECITSKWVEIEPVFSVTDGKEIRERRVATFGNLVIESPRYQRGQHTYFKTPQRCRLQGETYSAAWKVTATVRRGGPDGPAVGKSFEINVGEVPVMLGSRHCILRGKSADELLRLGEDPNDVFGYFIVGGMEKVVLKQEKLVVNRPLLMAPSKAQPTIRITTKTIRGTIVAELLSTDGVVEMKFQSLRQNTGDKNKDKPMSFNVVRVMRLVGRFMTHYNAMQDYGADFPHTGLERPVPFPGGDAPYQTVAEIEELVSKFITPSVLRSALNKLSKTFVDSFGGGEEAGDGQGSFRDEMEMMRKVGKGETTRAEKVNDIEAIFNNDLFTHLTEIPTKQVGHARTAELYRYKLHLLCFMLGRYLEVLSGHRTLDNRDSWSNKRAVGAGCMMEQLLRSSWYKILGEPQFKAQLNTRTVKGNEKHLEVTDIFTNSFKSKWGVPGYPMKDNVTKTVGSTSVLERYSEMTTVDVAVSRKNVANSIRQIQQTQYNVICPVATPEGDNCGIVKNTSATVKMSLERRDTELINILTGSEPGLDGKRTEYVLLDSDVSANNIQVMLNGKFLGWANDEALDGRDLQVMLREMRRLGHIAYDVGITQASNVIFVEMSPSRPIFPYLTVDYKTQQLVIDKKALRGASLATLLAEGAVEYVSAWEQEYTKVAPFESDISDRLALLDRTTKEVLKAESELERVSSLKEDKVLVQVREIVNRDAAVRDAREALTIAQKDGNGVAAAQKRLEAALASVTGQERVSSVFKARSELIMDAQLALEAAQAEHKEASKQREYDYCQIDPCSFLGVLACAIPYPDHNQAPRNTFQASMSKQPIGVSHVAQLDRNTDGKSKTAVFPTRPIVETEIASVIGLTNRNCGNNIMVAFLAAPSTEEDSFLIKKEFLDNGGFRSIKNVTYKQEVEDTGSVRKVFRRPVPKNDEAKARYDKIAKNGMPLIGVHFNEGDCIIGKVHIKTIDNGAPSLGPASSGKGAVIEEEVNESICLRVGDEGVVDRIFYYSTPAKTRVIVKLRSMHFPSMGDKFSPRNAQKGTAGDIVPANVLPYTSTGLVPDFCVNPSSIPSRMTLSYFFEMLDAKTGALEGRRKNGTAFRQKVGFDLANVRTILKDAGMDEYGEEVMTSGVTGEQMASTIFIAPVYMQALKHQALSKNQARGEGPVKPMTRQPPKSKANRGGIRFGEMERDAACAFGASSFVLERLCLTSDAYTPVFCAKCGFYADNVAGGEYACPLCNSSDFGRCTIPYAYKLLEHLLGAAGIRLRIKFSTHQQVMDRLFHERETDTIDEAEAFDIAQDELDEQEFADRDDRAEADMEGEEGDLE